MTITIVSDDGVATLAGEASGEDLWLAAPALGWTVTPEGLCRGPHCVPIPAGQRAEFVRADGAINVAALARHRGQAVVHDERRDTWVFGSPPELRTTVARSVMAPDFTLPGLDGRLHTLSALRGRKVLINSWASW